MTEPHDRHDAPPIPRLGPAATHLAASEDAAQRRDFGTAVRERFRAVTRGLEQRGVLEVRRARTARVTAEDASTALNERGELADPVELPSAAHDFDEIVYGGRPATEDEYRRLVQADRYSVAPPPVDEPAEITERRRKRKKGPRTRDPRVSSTPDWLRDWRFWAVLAGIVGAALLVYIVIAAPTPSAPDSPNPPDNPRPPTTDPDGSPFPGFGEGEDSIFQQLPGWAAYGGLQWVIAWVIVLWWRGRRRGSVVAEPLPVQAPANELLTGQAGLYRRSRDYEHIAAKLRAASLRRLRPTLGLTADTTPDRVLAAITARSGADPSLVAAALHNPVPDRGTLELVAAQLEWIEAEVL